MKIKPLNDWAVIRPSEAEDRTAGGIYIPETAKEKPAEGVVEAIGPGAFEEEKRGAKKGEKKERKFIPSTVKPGERVLYERYAGQRITIDGEELVLVREVSILGTLPPAAVRLKEDLPPLMLPSATSSPESRALAKRGSTSLATAVPGAGKKAAPKPKKSTAKKTAKPKKSAAKKTASKKAKKKR